MTNIYQLKGPTTFLLILVVTSLPLITEIAKKLEFRRVATDAVSFYIVLAVSIGFLVTLISLFIGRTQSSNSSEKSSKQSKKGVKIMGFRISW